jgi:hypothetical protein
MNAPSANPRPVVLAADLKTPQLSAFLSLICVGAGQLYNGNTQKAVILFGSAVVLGLIFGSMAVGLVIPIIIYAMIDAYLGAQKINASNRALLEDQALTLVAERSHKVSTIAAQDFVQAIYKAHQLFKNELLSQEEFSERKATTIDALTVKKPRDGADEFLMELIPLIKSGALTMDEAKTIKGYVL